MGNRTDLYESRWSGCDTNHCTI